MNTIFQNPAFKRAYLLIEKFTRFIPDKAYLKLTFRIRTGKKLNLDNPQTYNEKLQWLKLNDRKPIYTTMSDKYEVKKYVAEKIGEEYIIPTLGVWNHFDEIDFESLPRQFVLKCTHDSGGVVIVKDKDTFDKREVKKKIEQCLSRNFFWHGREWPYKNVQPRIIVEQYMEDDKKRELIDYKFFCFNGEVKAMFVATERLSEEETKFDFFDIEFNHLPFTNGHPNASIIPEKPQNYDLMIQLAKKLSANIPQVRVDLYEVNGKVYFGEYTFFHWGGMKPFVPSKWDETFGSWIDLNKLSNGIVKNGKAR